MEPTRAEVDRIPEPLVLEFGAAWCPHCQAIQPEMRALLARYPHVRHMQIEDGRGQPLGRSFRVKLWPNLVLMQEGKVFAQLARPSVERLRAVLSEFAEGSKPS